MIIEHYKLCSPQLRLLSPSALLEGTEWANYSNKQVWVCKCIQPTWSPPPPIVWCTNRVHCLTILPRAKCPCIKLTLSIVFVVCVCTYADTWESSLMDPTYWHSWHISYWSHSLRFGKLSHALDKKNEHTQTQTHTLECIALERSAKHVRICVSLLRYLFSVHFVFFHPSRRIDLMPSLQLTNGLETILTDERGRGYNEGNSLPVEQQSWTEFFYAIYRTFLSWSMLVIVVKIGKIVNYERH